MSLSKYTSTPETTNTARLARLILGPCTDVLRDILKKEIPPSDLSKVVKQWTDDLKKNRKRNPLNPSQNDIIFPSPTNQYGGNYSDLDISTMCIIFRNVSKIPQHLKGWGQNPDPADRSVAANIERIRLLRNESYGHIADISLSDSDFSLKWHNIRDIVVELERDLGTSTVYQESVKEIKTCSMDPELEHKYIVKLRAVEKLQSDVSNFSDTLSTMKENFNLRMETLSSEINKPCLSIEMLNDVKKKLSFRKDLKLEKEIETTRVMVNNHHKETEKVLVKTRAFDRAKELLEKNGHVVIKGVPGAGKTTLAKYLLKISIEGGKRPLQVFKFSKLYGRVSPFDNLAIFIDNAFGELSFSMNDLNEFLNKKELIESLVKSKNNRMGNALIVTVRNDIFKEITARQKDATLLFSSMTDLSTGEYALETEELIMFLDNYNLPGKTKEDFKLRQAELPWGFPQCCRLAHENPAFGKNLSNFLRCPSIFLKKYLETLIRKRAVKMSVLIYLLLKGGSVESSMFSVQKDRKIKSIALKMLELSLSLRILGEFHENVKVFEGFLTLYDKINDSFSFSHSSVQDNLFHILIDTLPEETILNCHPVLLQRLTTAEHLKSRNILVDAELFAIVSRRIIQSLRDRSPDEYESISLLDLWKDKSFFDYVLADQVCSNCFQESFDLNGNALLVHFAKSGQIGWVQHLLQRSCDKIQKYRSLNAASSRNHVQVVNLILLEDIKCDLNACFHAVQSGNLDLVLKICKSVDLNQTCLSIVRANTYHSLIQEACVSGQTHLVQPLIVKYPILKDIKSRNGDTVLHYASVIGDINISSYLVDNFPELIGVKNKDGFTALHSVNGNIKLFSFLIEKGFDINALTNNNVSVFHIACLCGWYDACVFLATNYPQLIDAKDNKGYTVLHAACENGDRKLISFLIEKDLDINAQTIYGERALHIVCSNGRYDACEFLATNYSQLIDVKDNDVYTILHVACENGDIKLISFLIGKGLDINAQTNNGKKVLNIACFNGNYEACKYLFNNYPHLIDVKDNNGYTVLHSACANGNMKIVSFLIELGMDVNALAANGKSVLDIACLYGNYNACEFLVTNYSQLIDVIDKRGYTALHSACVNGEGQLISFLIGKGLDINAKTNFGESVLHIACCHGRYDACEFLVTNYPKLIDVKTKEGSTILHYACINGSMKIISFLIDKLMDVNALNDIGENVLHIACRSGRYEACEFFVTDYPHLAEVKTRRKYTVLHSACVNGDRKLISFLIEKGLDIHALTDDGKSVLHISCLYRKNDACEYLITNFPQLAEVKDNKGYTVLHTACKSGDRKMIFFLIDRGLDINALTNDGDSVLHIACFHRRYHACEVLVIKYPQLIDVKNNKGYTALHSACVSGDSKLISFLIEKGFDVNALTNDGESVFDIARSHGNIDLCTFIVTFYPLLLQSKDYSGINLEHAAS